MPILLTFFFLATLTVASASATPNYPTYAPHDPAWDGHTWVFGEHQMRYDGHFWWDDIHHMRWDGHHWWKVNHGTNTIIFVR